MKTGPSLMKTSGSYFGVIVFNSISCVQVEAAVRCLQYFFDCDHCYLMRGVGVGYFEEEKLLKEPRLEETTTFISLAGPAEE